MDESDYQSSSSTSVKMTLTRAYAALGATVTAPRQAWARSADDGKSAIVTVWRDARIKDDGRIEVTGSTSAARANKYRVKVRAYAIWRCNSLFRVIWLTRLDNPTPRGRIKDAEPDFDLWMRVTSLDTVTGGFTAERVSR